jgi:hypothetical protein
MDAQLTLSPSEVSLAESRIQRQELLDYVDQLKACQSFQLMLKSR